MGADDLQALPFSRKGVETCEYIGPEGVFWSIGPKLLRSDSLDGPLTHVAQVPRPFARRILSKTRLGRRLGRETFYNVLPLPEGGVFFCYAADIGIIDQSGTVGLLGGRARRHRVLRGGVARLPDGTLVFGEYFDNAERAAVRIYRYRPPLKDVEEVYAFAPGEIRHVHSVRWDPFSARIIVTAGDIGAECRIVAFSRDFSVNDVLGQGDENWRSISPQFGESAIYFGTDAQFTQNKLFRYDRKTSALSVLAEVNGPVFYSSPIAGGWVFATSAELCPSQSSPEAVLYFLDRASEKVRVIARFAKDLWPKRYFQFGILNFPISTQEVETLPVSGTALRGLDGKFVMLGRGCSCGGDANASE